MQLVQLIHERLGRGVAIVDEPRLVVIQPYSSIYELALTAIVQETTIVEIADANRTEVVLEYDDVYALRSEWRLLPAFDHPRDPAHCLVTGTGLTHRASAENRDKMHEAQAAGQLTDSMRMYLAGVEGGRPAFGEIGAQPEWFYKGTGAILKAHGQPLTQPAYASDAGEEPEVAAAYVIDDGGRPWRVGVAAGNEFADHVMEQQNYLYLAHSKLRECAIGPELALDDDFRDLTGAVTITRGGQTVWTHEIRSGEDHMAHSLANLERHHFKYAAHRVPGQAHIHFLGASAFSFGAQMKLQEGDVMEVAWNQLGRPLRNPLHVEPPPEALVVIASLARRRE
jgi:hypothetical protein